MSYKQMLYQLPTLLARYFTPHTPQNDHFYPQNRQKNQNFFAATLNTIGNLPPEKRILLILDGIDELMANHQKYPDSLRKLAARNNVCIVCSARTGRFTLSDAKVGNFFRNDGEASSIREFDELPPLSRDEIREIVVTMAEREAGGFAKAEEQDYRSTRGKKSFFDQLAEKSEGLPYYLSQVIHDIKKHIFRPDEAEKLPCGLDEYFVKILNDERLVEGHLKGEIAFLLATAKMELSVNDLVELLPLHKIKTSREEIRKIMIRLEYLLHTSLDHDGSIRYAPYHDSLRERLLKESTIAWSGILANKAAAYRSGAAFPIYLFRRGIRHILDQEPAMQESEPPDASRETEFSGNENQAALDKACRLLFSFDYLMDRLMSTGGFIEDVMDLYANIDLVRVHDEMRNHDASGNELRLFLSRSRHLICRTTREWPAHKILLQLAMEEADGAVRRAAEEWLAKGKCDWAWLRCLSNKAATPSFLEVNAHEGPVAGVVALAGHGKLVSWGDRSSLAMWSLRTGELKQLGDPGIRTLSAQALPDGTGFLSVSKGGCFQLWDANGNQITSRQSPEVTCEHSTEGLSDDRPWAINGKRIMAS